MVVLEGVRIGEGALYPRIFYKDSSLLWRVASHVAGSADDACTARRNGPYVLWVTHEDGRIEPRSGRNLLRYLNHAVPPNTWFDGFDLYAARDIRPGEELTIDYGWDE